MNIATYPVQTIWGITAHMHYRVGTTDRDTIDAIMVHDEYVAKQFTYRDGNIFIDLGSHLGAWSILMAVLNSTFRVYAFDPVPENFELMKMNAKSNNLTNFYPNLLAVSDASNKEESIFYTDDSTPFGAMHKYVATGFGGSGKEIKMKTMGLNDILDMVQKVRVLKSDCEGCEVKGFPYVTPENLNKIDYIIGEFHPYLGYTREMFFQLFEAQFDDITYVMTETPPEGFGDFLYRNKRVELHDRLEQLGYF